MLQLPFAASFLFTQDILASMTSELRIMHLPSPYTLSLSCILGLKVLTVLLSPSTSTAIYLQTCDPHLRPLYLVKLHLA